MNLKSYICALLLALCVSCTSEVNPELTVDTPPTIFPDYVGATLPPNLVAPRFWVKAPSGVQDAQAIFSAAGVRIVVDSKYKNKIELSERQWDQLVTASPTVSVTIAAKIDGKWVGYMPFDIHVAKDSIDKFIAFRLIEPGYESWNEMGIYQRCLENYRTVPIITNKQTDYGCMNCHSFCQYDPHKMMLHLRKEHAGTYFIMDDEVTKIHPVDLTGSDEKIGDGGRSLVYPSWHPSGRYVAYSVNDTKQLFHTSDPNRIEVFDYASDVVVYDREKNEIVSTPSLMSAEAFETFPHFSPDGKRLYFCSADSVMMPRGYDRLKYNICAIDFDPASRTFGEKVDTIYDALSDGHSASFPRVSPDGRHLVFTKSDYGTFSIWHRDADLYMVDLASGDIRPLDGVNSDEAESYHSWSSNGHWLLFSSRRLDGLYTRPYLVYVDDEGNTAKPFIVPPVSEEYYDRLMKSFNVPEFMEHYADINVSDIINAE